MPSTAGWLMPSWKPNCSRPSGWHVHVQLPDRCDTGQIAHGVAGKRDKGFHRRLSRASAATTRCTSWEPSGASQFSGAFSPTSPMLVRACGHALLELGREGGQRLLWHADGLQPGEAECHRERDRPVRVERGRPGRAGGSAAAAAPARRARSSIRRPRYVPAYGFGRGIRAPAWMSPSSSAVSVSVVIVAPCQSSVVLLRSSQGAAAPCERGNRSQSAAMLEQRLERRVLQRLRGGRVVEHLLERLLQALGLDDLRHRPGAQNVEVAGCRALHRLDDRLEPADGLLHVRRRRSGLSTVELLRPRRTPRPTPRRPRPGWCAASSPGSGRCRSRRSRRSRGPSRSRTSWPTSDGVPLSKITWRLSRRPVWMFFSGGALRSTSANRSVAARSSSSWPGRTSQ